MAAQTIGACIRAHREARQWSLADLAVRCGLSRKLLHAYEVGRISNVPSRSIVTLARTFGITPGALYPEELTHV